jgi:hypothetical protein
VSGDGATVAVGAPLATVAGHEGQGAAYVFARPGGGWGSDIQPQHEAGKLTASDGAANDGLGGDNGGNAIAVSGDGSTVAAGAATATTSGCPGSCVFGPGAVYVFARPALGWGGGTETAKLTASDGHGDDRFGDAVAISSDGSTIVAGAWRAAVNSKSVQGAVYVFVKPGGGWAGTSQQETARLTAQDGQGDERLGRSVAASSDGSTVLAGSYFATVAANAAQGKVYLFERPIGGWATGTAQGELTASDGAASDELGFSVAISSDGETLVGGARFASLAQPSEGAAYVFAPPASIPSGPPISLFPRGVSGPAGGGGAPGTGPPTGSGSPAASGESIHPSSFAAAPSGPSAMSARRRTYGARVSYTLNAATQVRFTARQGRPGRYTGKGRAKRCVAQTHKTAKAKKCVRLVTLPGGFTLRGLVGLNSFRFMGRIGGKTLKPGTYSLLATPIANGKPGRAATATFRIKR